MGGLLSISRIIDAVNSFLGRWLSWLILAAVLVSSGNALVRYIFNNSANKWLELQWYLFGIVFLLCSAWTFLSNEHIRIDVVASRYSQTTRNIIELVGHTLFLIPLCLLMIYDGWPFFHQSFLQGAQLISLTEFWLILAAIVGYMLVSSYAIPALARVLSRPRAGTSGGTPSDLATFIAALIVIGGPILILYVFPSYFFKIIGHGEQSMNAGGLPVWPAKFIVYFAFILLLFQAISELIKRIAIMMGLLEEAHGGGHHEAAEAEAQRLLEQARKDGLVQIPLSGPQK